MNHFAERPCDANRLAAGETVFHPTQALLLIAALLLASCAQDRPPVSVPAAQHAEELHHAAVAASVSAAALTAQADVQRSQAQEDEATATAAEQDALAADAQADSASPINAPLLRDRAAARRRDAVAARDRAHALRESARDLATQAAVQQATARAQADLAAQEDRRATAERAELAAAADAERKALQAQTHAERLWWASVACGAFGALCCVLALCAPWALAALLPPPVAALPVWRNAASILWLAGAIAMALAALFQFFGWAVLIGAVVALAALVPVLARAVVEAVRWMRGAHATTLHAATSYCLTADALGKVAPERRADLDAHCVARQTPQVRSMLDAALAQARKATP